MCTVHDQRKSYLKFWLKSGKIANSLTLYEDFEKIWKNPKTR